MSDNDDTQPASAAAAPEVRSGWSEQDRRTLVITIAGTLAANLATVIIVGLAIGFARNYRVESSVTQLVVVLVGIFLGFMAIGAGSILRTEARTRRLGPRALQLSFPWLAWLLIGMGLLLMLLTVLIVTGLAAGVK